MDPEEVARRARIMNNQEKPRPEDSEWLRAAGIDPRLIGGGQGKDRWKPDEPTMPKDVLKGAGNWLLSRGTDWVSQAAGMPDAVFQWMRRVQEERNEELKKDVAKQNANRKPGDPEIRFNPQPTPEHLEIPYNIWGDKSVPGGDVRVRMPSADDVKQSIMRVTGHKDTPTPGVLGSDIDAALANVGPGALFKYGRTAQGVASNLFGGVAGQRAAELPGIKGTTLDLPASLLGGGIGSKVGGAPFRLQSTPGSLIREATKGVDWDAAIKRHREANAGGKQRLMGHEAIAEDINSPISQIAAAVQASGRTDKIGKFAKDRKVTLGNDFKDYMERFAPGGDIDLATVESNLGKSATAAVDRPKAFRSAQAQPFYDRGKQQPVDPSVDLKNYVDLLLLKQNLTPGTLPQSVASDMIDLRNKAPANRQVGGRTVPFTTGDLMSQMNEWENTKSLQAFQGDPKKIEETRVKIKPVVEDTMAGVVRTNPDVAAGEAFYRQFGTKDARTGKPLPSSYTESVDAARQAPVGGIKETAATATPGKGDIMRTFTERAVKPTSEGGTATPKTIADTIGRLNAEDWRAMNPTPDDIKRGVKPVQGDPQTAQRGFRHYLENMWDTAWKDNQGGPGIYGGAKFHKGVAGTEFNQANTHAWVKGITGSDTVAHGFNKFLDVLQRTGYTPNLGSPTASRMRINEKASTGSIPQMAVELPANLTGTGPLSRFLRERQHGKTFAELGKVLTDPDAVAKMQRLAMLDPDSPKAKAIVLDLFNTVMGAKGDPSTFPETGETKEMYR